MIRNILFAFALLTATNVFTQDQKKWSVEANYTIVTGNGIYGDDDFIDLGLKYRFVDFGLLNLGFGVNGGFSSRKITDTGFDSRRDDTYLIQPRVFTEISIPGLAKLRPSVGLGYSWLTTKSSININGMDESDKSNSGGFNFNFGVSYDLSKRLFVQAQYDFVDLNLSDDIPENVIIESGEINDKINNIRLGAGFRF